MVRGEVSVVVTVATGKKYSSLSRGFLFFDTFFFPAAATVLVPKMRAVWDLFVLGKRMSFNRNNISGYVVCILSLKNITIVLYCRYEYQLIQIFSVQYHSIPHSISYRTAFHLGDSTLTVRVSVPALLSTWIFIPHIETVPFNSPEYKYVRSTNSWRLLK